MAGDRGAADVVAHPARTPGARLAASRAIGRARWFGGSMRRVYAVRRRIVHA
ncbi:conserved hypothetical protein [Burkholderia pseudomallei 576]|nr:conserved hypothetical protein [Burkholderia pseudomallei 576]